MMFYLWLLGFSCGSLLTEICALSPLLNHEFLRTEVLSNSSLSPNPSVPLLLHPLSLPKGRCASRVLFITFVMAV